jgi:hypothetical protein
MSKNPTTERRKLLGVCIDCAGPREDASKLCCLACAGIRNSKKGSTKSYQAHIESGMCGRCGKPRDRATKLCSQCTADTAAASKAWRERRKADGTRCMYCTEPRWHSSTSCRYHFVEKLTHNYNVPKEHVEALAKRLEDCNFLCAYTGQPLVPGVNASLDHIVSRSTDPSRASDPLNLVWCDRTVNNMKTDYSIPELLTFAKALVAREASLLALHNSVATL